MASKKQELINALLERMKNPSLSRPEFDELKARIEEVKDLEA